MKEDSAYWKHAVSCVHTHLVENVDYLTCRLCTYKARILTKHLKSAHDIDKSNYAFPMIAPAAWLKYSEVGKVSGRGHGESKSRGILASESARVARRKNLAAINQRPERRKRSSEVAKKTSSRPDIIERRTKNLENWRVMNPEDFYQKCLSAMINVRQSRPEKKLFEQLLSFLPNIKRNQRIYNVEFSTISHRRQIDILDAAAKLVIEFDGPVHFKPFFGEERLAKVKKSDSELNEVLVSNGYKVIRVAYDQYVKNDFKEDCVTKIIEAVASSDATLCLIGESYGESYLSVKDR